jgi:hypothetical protein
MNQWLKWFGKTLLSAAMWVFILSINYQGKTLFSYAHDILVENTIVEALDRQLADIWHRVSEGTKAALKSAPETAEQERI